MLSLEHKKTALAKGSY